MKITTKTIFLILMTAFMGSMSCVYGDSTDTSELAMRNNIPKRNARHEFYRCKQCNPPSCKQCNPPKCCETFCALAPRFCQSLEGRCHFALDAEALYWRSSVEGLECSFGRTEISERLASAVLITDINETDDDPSFDWKWGFRVGALFDTCSGWNVSSYWTHMNGKAHRNSEPDNHGSWKLQYNVIDLDLGHYFWTSPCFLFDPFIGVRGAIIKERLSTDLSAQLTTGTGSANIFIDNTAKQKYWGVGPQLGAKADWYLGTGFSLVGTLDFVLLYGHFKIHSDYSTTLPASVENVHLKTRSDSVITGFDALLGIKWETFFCCDRMAFSLQVSGEHHSLFDFNKIGGGDLDLDGVTFSVGLQF